MTPLRGGAFMADIRPMAGAFDGFDSPASRRAFRKSFLPCGFRAGRRCQDGISLRTRSTWSSI